jgi:hypothetical protein
MDELLRAHIRNVSREMAETTRASLSEKREARKLRLRIDTTVRFGRDHPEATLQWH